MKGREEEEERLWESLGTSGLCFSSGTACSSVVPGTFKRGRGQEREREREDGEDEKKTRLKKKKRTSVKCPVLHFYGTKKKTTKKLICFYFLFPTSVIVSFFFSGVLVKWPFVC